MLRDWNSLGENFGVAIDFAINGEFAMQSIISITSDSDHSTNSLGLSLFLSLTRSITTWAAWKKFNKTTQLKQTKQQSGKRAESTNPKLH